MAITDISDSSKVIWVVGGTIPSVRTISTATWASGSGGVATYTTTAVHGYAVGGIVTVSGITPSGYNQTGTITTVPTTTTFKVALVSNPGAYASGGSVQPNYITGGIDLHDQSNTFLLTGTSLGTPNRGATWLIPKVPGAPALLSQTWDEPTVVTLVMSLKYGSVANLIAGADAIRSAFNSANTLWHSYRGQNNLRSFTTYKSPVPPLVVGDDFDQLNISTRTRAERWVLNIYRQPWPDGSTSLPV